MDANKIQFRDANFRLACLDVLFDAGHFAAELEEVLAIPVPDDEYTPNVRRMELISRIPISQEHLDSITSFAPDGGGDVYFHVLPRWSGEEDELYIKSFADLKLLRNLRSLSVYAVAEKSSLDFTHLLELKHLKQVNTDWFYVAETANCDAAVETLKNRGVTISINGSRTIHDVV